MRAGQITARPGHCSRGSGSGRQWRRWHWGRARLYQGSTVDWSGDGRQGMGTCAAGGAEAGHGKGPGLGHWMAHS